MLFADTDAVTNDLSEKPLVLFENPLHYFIVGLHRLLAFFLVRVVAIVAICNLKWNSGKT